jgi:hypothetical protein
MRAIHPASFSVTCTPPYFGQLRKDKLWNTSFRSILQFSVVTVAKFTLKISDMSFQSRPDTGGWDTVLPLTKHSVVYGATCLLRTVPFLITPDTHALLCQVLFDEQCGKIKPSMWHLYCWCLSTKYGWCNNVTTDYIFVFCGTVLVGTKWFQSSGHSYRNTDRSDKSCSLWWAPQSSIQTEKLLNFDCNEGMCRSQ